MHPAGHDGPEKLSSTSVRRARDDWKLPGMGFALASEFLRNLQWRGFKPDTHVKRLLDDWLKDQLRSFEDRASELAAAVGVRTKEARENIQYGLAGLFITPSGESPSKIDNLVWLIGAKHRDQAPFERPQLPNRHRLTRSGADRPWLDRTWLLEPQRGGVVFPGLLHADVGADGGQGSVSGLVGDGAVTGAAGVGAGDETGAGCGRCSRRG